MDLETYTVLENETIFSISLKFNMPLYNLLRLNQLSEDSLVYPGMVLKIKQGKKRSPSPEEIEQLLLNKVEMYYCSKEGDVRGILSYNEHLVIFTPNCIKQTYCVIRNSAGFQEKESLDFHQCLDFKDILSVSLVEYPGFDADNLQQEQLYLKIIISNTDSESIDPNYQKRNIPKGTMYFRVTFYLVLLQCIYEEYCSV